MTFTKTMQGKSKQKYNDATNKNITIINLV